MLSFPPARILLTLALALAAAVVCLALHTPLPWMIGPLVATALLSISGVPTASSRRLRNAGQWTLGAVLGLYFTPQVTALVAGLWWAIALGVAWALFGGWLFGAWLYRVHAPHLQGVPAPVVRATSYFSGAIGAASEMTLLAEREHARTDLVAASHSLRLVIVTVTIPFALQFSGLHGLDLLPPAVRVVDVQGLALLAGLTGLGALAMDRLGRANPWFMGALLVSMGLAMAGITLSAVPQALVNAAQLVIGVSLGVRFRPGFLHTAPRWLGSVAIGTLVLLAVCALFAVALSRATGLHWVTMVLASAPGGIAEMSITAKVLQLGVPVVTAFQVCRLIAVLLLVAPLYRWIYPATKPAG
ncbi:AbrB family transcriptional regulator [Acidovorax sp. SUPP3434]|uniref:AbrB family transcriptional regulator n=1 Tax=Acidovorax sp. SUPP3434 TaxID=2920880 RepID=UPI0023DE1EBD|nr:AbrB family transcriptional regulator [Acidovorax sp. SUPP3434]GKT01287.1 AbrB family transcriptional regulator [Acidovorax sp. SUPP3434]